MKWLARVMSCLVSVVLLSGCYGPELDQLDDTLSRIRQTPGTPSASRIEPLVVYPVEAYGYSDTRSPFQAVQLPSQVADVTHDDSLLPDVQRTPEPLERFAISELRMVGTLVMGGRHVALIETPDGRVTSVRAGDYVGSNGGRITHIEAHNVRITERITTQQGWQEQQVLLSLKSPP
ncbi:Type IV pilus biogenesis protein PilP [Halomonas citrativorans]|uniref:Type IV pilus biogenesis protein PilP n=1 Tax=Halomonas citrativorans TaxID=2742612 RepID=A0A1R4HXU3_9GAMM|nr:pilus assembly protein PilP [Halomonas citrativorans]SJN12397.1 Type IV pilus biogenesis protein PilP [Halomonas citrativorans]